ncbi:hypothetical protein L0128_03640 [candidate division KSB1 bacterium]|nr:hypothetical protein [candidate division KSB1 bacterium]
MIAEWTGYYNGKASIGTDRSFFIRIDSSCDWRPYYLSRLTTGDYACISDRAIRDRRRAPLPADGY